MSEEAVDQSASQHEPSPSPPSKPQSTHRVIEPSVLSVGSPVHLIATKTPDGSANLAPPSSHFALGGIIVVGPEEGGKSRANARWHGQITVNFPDSSQWEHAERLASVTGANPVLDAKADYEFEPEKCVRAGLTATASALVDVPGVVEAPIQLEARVRRITDGAEVGWTRKSPVVQLPDAVSRWELNGGTWRVRQAGTDSAVVELRRCDGGEIVDLATLTAPRDLRWARVQLAADHPQSEENR